MIASGCTSAADDAEPEPTAAPTPLPVEGGTVRVAWGARPDDLNPLGEQGAEARRMLEPVLLGAYVQRPDMGFRPQLLSADAEVATSPFSVSYWIHPDARWSDGTPLTSADFAYTARMHREEPGYALITRTERLGPKRVRFTFSRPYGAYRALFDPVLPAHAPTPSQWGDTVPVASGPLEFDQWEEGTAILKRNENYWATPAYLDEVILVPSRDDLALLLAENAVDVVEGKADADLATRVRGLRSVVAKVIAGGSAQMLLLNDDHWPLRRADIRKAVALAVDRSTLVEQIIADASPDTRPLQSLVGLPAGGGYTPDFELYDNAEDDARALLDRARCLQTGGSRRCQNRPLVLRYPAQPSGTAEQIQWQLLAGDLADVGVAAQPVTQGPTDLELVTWTWPWEDDLSEASQCADGAKACDRKAAHALAALGRAVTDDEVASARTAAGRDLASSPRVLPLYQHPVLTAWREKVSGVQGTAADEGLLWNTGEWFVRP